MRYIEAWPVDKQFAHSIIQVAQHHMKAIDLLGHGSNVTTKGVCCAATFMQKSGVVD